MSDNAPRPRIQEVINAAISIALALATHEIIRFVDALPAAPQCRVAPDTVPEDEHVIQAPREPNARIGRHRPPQFLLI